MSALPIYLHALGMVNALGLGKRAIAERLFSGQREVLIAGLSAQENWLVGNPATTNQSAYLGQVTATLPALPDFPTMHPQLTRNNQLLWAAAHEIDVQISAAIRQVGAARVGVVLGTSTSGVAEGELALQEWIGTGVWPAQVSYRQQELGAPAEFLARHYGLTGPAYVISTACTSSAKVFAAARRLLQQGVCDVVLAGGVDSLCRLTVNGFAALESTSQQLNNPFSQNRCGINIGEAAALFLVSSHTADQLGFAAANITPVMLCGVGESSDAYHMSSPHPEGRGAEVAMRAALQDANITEQQVTYLNLHGTATPKNDAMESLAVSRVFPLGIAASSTKPLTGHTLGAAGATELGFCWLALSDYNQAHLLPPHLWDGIADATLPSLNLTGLDEKFMPASAQRPTYMMSNSFAFGGNNISLLIGRQIGCSID